MYTQADIDYLKMLTENTMEKLKQQRDYANLCQNLAQNKRLKIKSKQTMQRL